jgi:hypothetical protein
MSTPAPEAERSASSQISQRVRVELARHRARQIDLSAALGLAKSGISRRVHGEQVWDVNELVVVAQTIGCDLSDLIPNSLTETTPRRAPGPASPPED